MKYKNRRDFRHVQRKTDADRALAEKLNIECYDIIFKRREF